MSIAKHAQASRVMSNLGKGNFTSANKGGKFRDFGSVVEDSIYAQQVEADKRLAKLQAKKA